MISKKLLTITLIILIFSLTAVNAGDNDTVTDDDLISNYTYTVNVEDFTDRDVWTISVTDMPGDAKGNITISIDDKKEYDEGVCLGGNYLILNELNLDDGIHNAAVTYSGDDKYSGFIKNATFENKFYTTNFENGYIRTYDNFDSIMIMTMRNQTGYFELLVDGKVMIQKQYFTRGSGSGTDASGLSYGEHTYELIYTGGNHKSFTKKGVFNVSYYFDVSCSTGADITAQMPVTFQRFGDARITSKIRLNNKTYDFNNSTIVLNDFTFGDNTVEVTANYDSYEQTKTFHFNVSPLINVPETLNYSLDNHITFKMLENSHGLLTVNVDGEYYNSSELLNGSAAIPLNLDVGKHIITLNYTGDNSNLVPLKNYTVNVKPAIFTNGDEIKFIASESVHGNMAVSGASNTIINVVYGSATIPVTDYSSNKLIIKYGNYTWKYNINLAKNTTHHTGNVISSKNSLENGETATLTVKLDDAGSAKLIIFADYIPIAEYDVNNNSIIELNDTLLEKADSFVHFNSVYGPQPVSDYHLPLTYRLYVDNITSDKGTVDVHYIAGITAFDTTFYYHLKTPYTVKVYDILGNPVRKNIRISFLINDRYYYNHTKSGGVASVIINTLPGKYDLKIFYEGYYVTKKVTIKPSLVLKKVNVRKYASKLVLIASLKKPVKGEKITFKFKGKKYVAKTNKNGVAKVTVKKSVLKKLKIGRKITYSAKFYSLTVKKTVKIKR